MQTTDQPTEKPVFAPVLTRIIDHACGPLLERLERSKAAPAPPRASGRFRRHRRHPRQEITDGLPLLLLGLELAPAETVPIDGYAFED